MDSKYFEISRLVDLYLNNEISDEEFDRLMAWCDIYPSLKTWLKASETKKQGLLERRKQLISMQLFDDWQHIEDKAAHARRRSRFQVLAAAASVLFLLGLGLLFVPKQTAETAEVTMAKVEPVRPASKEAILTLSDGTVIGLTEDSNQVITEGSLKLKAGGEALNYTAASSDEVYMHKITVPRGATYFVELADGTKVWLNAASEIDFPSAFKGKERMVSLTGEAYFEIAKNPLMPFRVMVDNTVVEAVGTAFNINTHWKAGLVKTILTEGKIKVECDNKDQFIEKGFAAITGNGHIDIRKADLEEALAWKDGFFYFNEKTLPEILDEICRWYNVNLKVATKLNTDTYKGGLKRTESIAAVCRMLEDLSGYDLKMSGRTLIIK